MGTITNTDPSVTVASNIITVSGAGSVARFSDTWCETAPGFVNAISVFVNTGRITLNIFSSPGFGGDTARVDLIPAVEQNIRLEFLHSAGSFSVTGVGDDTSEPYSWIPPNVGDVTTWAANVNNGDPVTVRLSYSDSDIYTGDASIQNIEFNGETIAKAYVGSTLVFDQAIVTDAAIPTPPPTIEDDIVTSANFFNIVVGHMATLNVKLSDAPTANVTVTLTETSAFFSLDDTSLTFTTGNWNVDQPVTITAASEGFGTIALASSGGGYTDTATVSVTVTAVSGNPPNTVANLVATVPPSMTRVTWTWDLPVGGGVPTGFGYRLTDSEGTVLDSGTLAPTNRQYFRQAALGETVTLTFTVWAFNDDGAGPSVSDTQTIMN